MPVMDGLQALPLIRKACPETVVVMLSAFGPKYGLQHQARLLGAHGYILKGARMEQVLVELREILDDLDS
jgi:YesN/AraC family two-component response regulator